MLALKLTNGKRNIVHLIFGPQTQFQFDMIGFVYLELGKMLKSFDEPGLPLGIVVTRCDDEAMTYQAISSSLGQSKTNEAGVIFSDNHYMEMISKIASINADASTTFFNDDGENPFSMDNDDDDDDEIDETVYAGMSHEDLEKRLEDLKGEVEKEKAKHVHVKADKSAQSVYGVKATYRKGDPRGIYLENCVCALCTSAGVYARKGIAVMCADCLKIEYGRGKLNVKSLTKKQKAELDEFYQSTTDKSGDRVVRSTDGRVGEGAKRKRQTRRKGKTGDDPPSK